MNEHAWAKLKQFVVTRTNYFENQYIKHNLASDQIQAAAYRVIYEAMVQLEGVPVKKPGRPKKGPAQ